MEFQRAFNPSKLSLATYSDLSVDSLMILKYSKWQFSITSLFFKLFSFYSKYFVTWYNL